MFHTEKAILVWLWPPDVWDPQASFSELMPEDSCQAEWHMPNMVTLRRLGLENRREFKTTSLDDLVSSSPA